MTSENKSPTLEIPLATVVELAIEHWRLSNWLKSLAAARPDGPASANAPARHALRKIENILRLWEIEAVSLDGRPFDPGLAVRVVDVVDDPEMPAGKTVITETLSPMILRQDAVLRSADVIVSRGISH